MTVYYDRLKKRVHTVVRAKKAVSEPHTAITDCIAECYLPIHKEVQGGTHTIFHLPGGRGSAKSSFVSLEIVEGIMNDPQANGIVFRRYANTLRESVYSQISWAIDALGVAHLWRGSVSPMVYTYIPTGQQIFFRGLDDAAKLKSIRCRTGTFKFVWFEEFSELNGANQVRNVLQSVVRGGNDFRIFNSFNPPLSVNAWANKYILIPDERAVVFRTTYKDIPADWLGEAFILEAERLEQINPDAYRHEYLGECISTGSEVFPNITTREITDAEIEQMQYIYCGIDWGFSVDPFAFVRCSYDRRTQTIYLLDEIVKRGFSNHEIAEAIRQKGYDLTGRIKGYMYPRSYSEALFDLTSTKEKQLIICDSAEPKSVNDLQKEGLKCIACKKYPGSVVYGVKWLQTKHIVIDPRRTPVSYQEFTEYEYETTKDGEILASLPDANNHCIDSVRYSLDRIINNSRYSA